MFTLLTIEEKQSHASLCVRASCLLGLFKNSQWQDWFVSQIFLPVSSLSIARVGADNRCRRYESLWGVYYPAQHAATNTWARRLNGFTLNVCSGSEGLFLITRQEETAILVRLKDGANFPEGRSRLVPMARRLKFRTYRQQDPPHMASGNTGI